MREPDWKGRSRPVHTRVVRVDQERQNWVKHRRRTDLDVAGRLQLAMDRHNPAQDLVLLFNHRHDVVMREPALLRDKSMHVDGVTRDQPRVGRAKLVSKPRKVEPHL